MDARAEKDAGYSPPAGTDRHRPFDNRVTRILQAAHGGNPNSTAELFPILYEELRQIARQQMALERPGQTLQPTALVHEAYLRLVGDPDLRWENRAHFFAAAARVMRRILVDRARKRQSVKHGGEFNRISLDGIDVASDDQNPEQLLALNEALDRLDRLDPRQAQIVHFRYFAGLTIEDTARALNLAPSTVTDEWKFAAAWLYREMCGGDGSRG